MTTQETTMQINAMQIKTVQIKTTKPFECINLTEHVRDFASRTKVESGTITVRTMHTTSAIVINENEAGIKNDLELLLEKLIPKTAYYAHDDPKIHPPAEANERKNGFAHLQALLLGNSATMTLYNGKINLGKWESIIFIELDGPRERTIELTAVGIN